MTVRGRSILVVGALVAAGSLGAQPTPSRARIVEDLRLDATAEDFPRVRVVKVGPQGQIVVPIDADMQLRIYDATGKRIAVFGRKGAGPGEFTGIGNMGWKADTLWVEDYNQRRITYIGPDYKLLRAVPNATFDPPPSKADRDAAAAAGRGIPLSSISPMAMRPDGAILGWIMKPVTDAKPNRRAYGGDPALARIAPDGSRRTVVDLPWSGEDRYAMTVDGFGRSIPFVATPAIAIASVGDRVAHMTSAVTSRSGGTFTVSAYRTTGEPMFVRTFPFAGVAIPASVRDSALEAQGPRPGPGGRPAEGSPDMPARFQAIAREKMPAIFPAVELLIVGLDNTLWVGLRRTPEGQPFVVLDAKGDPVASILVPPNSRLRQASSSHVYMTETDTDGLVSVVRYRVTGIPR